MKKVALISDGWKRLVTYSWVDGIMGAAKELGLEICLYHFNTNGNWSHNALQNQGEYSLYTLTDFNKFDGVVFDGTNTTDQNQIARMKELLKSLTVPVVSINYAVEGAYYVGNDNKKLFREMIDHLYYQHDCRDFVFAGGPDYNYENQMRFQAFKEAMEDYGIPLEQERCLFGDFDFGTGVRYMKEWAEAQKPLPGAFVCANDNIAAGICSEAYRLGYEIPRDFLVTGFDNLDKAAYFNPQISTVEHNRGNIGKWTLRILNDIWQGKAIERFQYLDSECIYGESCGCPNSGRVDYRNYIKWQIEYGVKLERDDDAVLALENQIAGCNDYQSLFDSFAKYIESLDCDGIYIVVDRRLLNPELNTVFRTDHYDLSDMVVGYASEGGKILEFDEYIKLHDHVDDTGVNVAYMFSPLHFLDQLVGFTILRNPRFLYYNAAYYDVHSVFVTKLENLFKQIKLQNVYNRDVLTGLYNRVAYSEMIVPLYREYRQMKRICAMVFFDVDFFKQINDIYGHKYGDEVLKKIARALEENKPQGSYAYRFGGDEFVVFIPDATTEKTDHFIEQVEKSLCSAHIHVSHGVIVTDPYSDNTLDDYLVMADQRMYQVKSARKEKYKNSYSFLKGVDISSLPEKLDNGEKFYDVNGECMDVFTLLKKNNVNAVRVRIWNEPDKVEAAKGYCDLSHTIQMAKWVKDNGMYLMLDYHYSDYWADPGQQRKPRAWESLSFEELKQAVHDYTKDTLLALKEEGCLPDFVQIGNEIRSGMLFPDGAVPNYENLAMLLNAGIRAVREVSPLIRVMIHLDQGGRFYVLKEWFDAAFAAGLDPIDAIGISFYPFWHGTFMDLKSSMEQLIARYKLPVYVVETAHPWRHCENEHISREMMQNAGLPAGKQEQKEALELVMQIASTVSGALPTGIFYWEPLGITGKEYGSWDENMGMLDENGRLLSSFEAYRTFDPKHPTITDLDSYMEKLYEVDESETAPSGLNLIRNGDFSEGLSGWWVNKNNDDVIVEEREEEIYISSTSNFTLELLQDVQLRHGGRYRLSAEYRGSNTTDVVVELFLKVITCNGEEVYTKNIYPSDVRFTTYLLDEVELPAGQIKVGIRMKTPPVFGRIRNFSLVRVEE